ncbi:hypothetical protein GGS20DRAFT_532476 [Poronia punctata]|nr:hypothetical protein GGS20DRAFT_532476 [Poronia punctata]
MTEELADVFAFRDYDFSKKWLDLPSETLGQFFNPNVVNSTKAINIGPANAPQPFHAALDGFFKLPDLPAQPVADVFGNEENRSEQEIKPLHNVDLTDLDIINDLWHDEANPPDVDADYKTWEAFFSPAVPQSAPLFITEAGPPAYDAALKSLRDPLSMDNLRHLIVLTKPYVAGLLALTLGRGSVFFIWDTMEASFIPAADEMRISGYSGDVLIGLEELCINCGTATRFLSSYVQLAYRTRPGAVRVALAKAIDVLLLGLQQQIGKRGGQIKSLLQLQSLVQPVETVLVYFRELVRNISRMRTDEQVLSHISNETRYLENQDYLLRTLMCEVLQRATEPWADFAQKWIGVKAEEGFLVTKDGPGRSFVKVENIAHVDDFGFEVEERDYILDEAHMPDFVPPDIALVLFETGRNLRLLRTHHPDHPLSGRDAIYSSKPPGFMWLFDWKSIGDMQTDVQRYEEAVLRKISSDPSGRTPNSYLAGPATSGQNNTMLQVFGNDGSELEQRLLASIQELDQAPGIAVAQDKLIALLEKCLFREDGKHGMDPSGFDPHWSLVPLLSFGPLVTSQARLINREYMKLLFSSHDLREHLRVQKEFQLLGNGMFCSRLSHALFDPDLETAERKDGVALTGGIMGLRMNGRETWPPASSELRLALMGILSETYFDPLSKGKDLSSTQNTQNTDLPGDLSFSLRDLPAEEIDKCMDPTSLEALDFLRLAYKAPQPLSPILTPVLLVKYDKIFKFLLRMLRMLYIVGQLHRDTQTIERRGQIADNAWLRFRFEAQHFVQSMATYFFDTGIQTSWNHFERWLDGVEVDLWQAGTDNPTARVVSPDEVREQHEKMLNYIMNVLLLRKRQQPVLALVEDIFSLILKFSRQVQLEVGGKVEGNASNTIIQKLYGTFKKKMEVFVTVCRGLQEKGGATKRDPGVRQGDSLEDENAIDRLLVNLDMLGYYSRPRF